MNNLKAKFIKKERKIEEIITSRPSLQEMLKGVFQAGKKKSVDSNSSPHKE